MTRSYRPVRALPKMSSLVPVLASLLPLVAQANRVDALLAERFEGDRSAACVVAAVIDGDAVDTGRYCEDSERAARLDSAFEIGSVSKTLNAALLAHQVAAGSLELDAPLSRYVPEGVAVPSKDGVAITLRHLVTHTAGLPALPPGFAPSNAADPYADLSVEALFAALGKTELASKPGSAWAYSNYGAMLLSAVIAKAVGGDYDAALRSSLFDPLNMRETGATTLPSGVGDVVGHRPGGEAVSSWRFAPALAGVGGVRATLADMVRYVQAQLGTGDADTVAILKATQTPQSEVGRPMALGWLRSPLNGRELLAHEGGTGGFSSFVAFDPKAGRGVIVLADTALTNLGGLSDVGVPLFDATVPVGAPRRAEVATPEKIATLVGVYRLANGMAMQLGERDGRLTVQVPDQPEFVLDHDSRGDFYPQAFDALLKPAPGGEGFVWVQGGGAVPATRVAATLGPSDAPAAAPDLSDYAGTYPLMPGFELRVFAADGVLKAQATGQGAFDLAAAGRDRFEAKAFGIVIDFERDERDAVIALALAQGGQVMRGARR